MSNRVIVDPHGLRSAIGALGAARLAELMVILEVRIEWISYALAATPGDRAALLASLHQSRGSAVSLGFSRLNRALADVEQRLNLETIQAAAGNWRSDAVGSEEACLFGLGDVVRAAWQVSLAVAVRHSPELGFHRPFASNR